MRLIDLDAFYEVIKRSRKEGNEIYPEYYDDVLENMPVVEAIPVEWIEKWLRNQPLYDDDVCQMLEEWREINE